MGIKIELSAIDWHKLLLELEHAQRFINRETIDAKELYEKIAAQLS
jgi:hypothetical protein